MPQPRHFASLPDFARWTLDLAGRIPSVTEARQFLDDRSPDKRQALIERLLESPRYVTHFANYWRNLWIPEVPDPERPRFNAGFDAWVRQHLSANTGYDQMVRELVTLPVDPERPS